MEVEKRIVIFVKWSNWVLLSLTSLLGVYFAPGKFALGIFLGGLLVTISFHMLARTLRKAYNPKKKTPFSIIVAKYYIRFMISITIIFFLIFYNVVHPVGLIIGLSVVVASIMIATAIEVKNLIMKEAI